MGETVIVALITGGCALLGSVITVWASGNKTIYRIARVEEKMDRLEKKVDEHNRLQERMGIVEQSTKSAHHRIDELRKER